MAIALVPSIRIPNASWHMTVKEGKRIFRFFSEAYDKRYSSDEMTIDGVLRYELFLTLAKAINNSYMPRIAVRDLTGFGWWKKGRGSDGDMKEIVDYGEDRHGYIRELHDRADREATAALNSIEAYRAYVAAGGDPDQVPVMTFVDGKFVVEMKPHREA